MSIGFGSPHRHLRRCESTNDLARRLAEAGAPPGTVVTAEEQTAGRGRQGRPWSAPAGKALLYSAVARVSGERLETLPLAVGVAVCEAVESLRAGREVRVKWPNDVWLDGRKCAGILVEARPQPGWAVIGIGLNLLIGEAEFPQEVRGRAASVFEGRVTGGGWQVAEQVAGGRWQVAGKAKRAVDGALARWVHADRDQVLAAFAARDALRGRSVTWAAGTGVAEGVDGRGNLLVRTEDGLVSLAAGEVHLGG